MLVQYAHSKWLTQIHRSSPASRWSAIEAGEGDPFKPDA